jgi:hypothetical protein
MVLIANISLDELRVENVSAADRGRLELVLPIPSELDAAASAPSVAVEHDLRASQYVLKVRAGGLDHRLRRGIAPQGVGVASPSGRQEAGAT